MTCLKNMAASAAACCYWLTGLSGAGKSTLARKFREVLLEHDIAAIVLDGDELRQGLNRDLGYDRDDRAENVRRIAEVARFLVDAGFVVLVAAISPYRDDRKKAQQTIGAERFFETFVDADLATCTARDPKGLYRCASSGLIPHFTDVSDPYEPPEAPALHIDTTVLTVEQSMDALIEHYTNQYPALQGGNRIR